MIRGYRRRRGWSVWHGALLPRVETVPPLHVLMDEEEPQRDPAEAAEERLQALLNMKAAMDAVLPQSSPEHQTEPEEPTE